MKSIYLVIFFSFFSCSTIHKTEKPEIKRLELERIENEIANFNSPENIQEVKAMLINEKYFNNTEELANYDIYLDPIFMIDEDCECRPWKKMYYVDSTRYDVVNNSIGVPMYNNTDTLKFLNQFKKYYPKAILDTVKLYEVFFTIDYTTILKPYKNNTVYSCIQRLLEKGDRLFGSYNVRLYSKTDSSFKFFYVSSYDNSINLSTDDQYIESEIAKSKRYEEWYIPKSYQLFKILTKKGELITYRLIIINNMIYSEQCLRIKKRKILNIKEIIDNHIEECEECEIDNYLRWKGIK